MAPILTAMVHFQHEENMKIEITEVEAGKTSVICINLGTSNLTIALNEKQAELLCEKLEEKLYDEPTYRQLSEEVEVLENRLEIAEEALAEYREQEEEQRAFRKAMCHI